MPRDLDGHATTWGVGIIGLGAMGTEMLGTMREHARFRVVAAHDPDPARVDAVREMAPEVEIAAGAGELVSRVGVDVVYVASPPAMHVAHAHAALDAGRALFCEKPLGISLDDSRALERRIVSLGVTNAVNFNHAAAYEAETVLGWLRDGVLGAPRYVTMCLHLPAWPRPFQAHARWLAGREQGGFSREMLSHWVYLSRRLLGDGRVEFARVRRPRDAAASETALTAELDFGGTPAWIVAAVGGAGPIGMRYTLYGRDASVRLSSGGGLERYAGDGWRPVARPPGVAANPQRALDALAASLDGRTDSVASVSDALAVQEIVERMLAC